MLIVRARQLFKGFDWLLLILVVILLAISLSAIYSVDLSHGEKLDFFPKQTVAVIIGLALMFIASFLQVSFYRAMAKLAYLFSSLLLALVLFFGETIRGTTGWFHLAGFSFQPAEFAKVSLILFLAWWIERYGRRFEKWQFVFTSGAITLFLIGLIMFQPDFGSSLILGGIWLLLLFLTGTKKRYFVLLFINLIILFLAGWFFFLADYQKERIFTFVNPAGDPLGAGYNVSQSVIAIGSGKLLGRGLGFGSQSQLHFLPEAQTDFIFSVIAEELGFVGANAVLLLYFLICWRLLIIAKTAKDDFSVFLVLGILALWFIHIFVNLGAAMGFLPVVGVTLPFLSYGGSSLIINLLALGIAQSVARAQKTIV